MLYNDLTNIFSKLDIPKAKGDVFQPLNKWEFFFSKCHFILKWIFNGYLVSSVDIDVLVFQHQGISYYIAEYTPMSFQLFMG